jgi:plasmid stability protein
LALRTHVPPQAEKAALRDPNPMKLYSALNIDDKVIAELKREAARQGRTMSELVESALRLLLLSQRKRQKLVALPTFHGGDALVDIDDRDTKPWRIVSAG